MKLEGKYLFGIAAIGTLGAMQVGAWILGYNGQFFNFTTAGIAALISFLLGLNLPSPAEKKAVSDFITSYINHKKP